MLGIQVRAAGLAMLIWLGTLIPFHRLPLPQGYATAALSLALALCALGMLRSRRGPFALMSSLALLFAVALLASTHHVVDALHQRWLGVGLSLTAALALWHNLGVPTTRIDRVVSLLREVAIGCVLAVLMLMPFLPLARLRMPVATALALVLVATLAHALRRRSLRRLHGSFIAQP